MKLITCLTYLLINSIFIIITNNNYIIASENNQIHQTERTTWQDVETLLKDAVKQHIFPGAIHRLLHSTKQNP